VGTIWNYKSFQHKSQTEESESNLTYFDAIGGTFISFLSKIYANLSLYINLITKSKTSFEVCFFDNK
jgi:hypothetical protein